MLWQGLAGFAADYVAKGYTSQAGDAPDASSGYTSFCARTFLQPQLQKAVRVAEKKTKGDCNLKDFILFPKVDCLPTSFRLPCRSPSSTPPLCP